jgi:hypothetical protein
VVKRVRDQDRKSEKMMIRRGKDIKGKRELIRPREGVMTSQRMTRDQFDPIDHTSPTHYTHAIHGF